MTRNSKQLQEELVIRNWQRKVAALRQRPVTKKDCKLGYKQQNTFERNLKGVPGGSQHQGASIVKMIAAKHTGTKTRPDTIGFLASAKNCNTTQGSYIETRLS